MLNHIEIKSDKDRDSRINNCRLAINQGVVCHSFTSPEKKNEESPTCCNRVLTKEKTKQRLFFIYSCVHWTSWSIVLFTCFCIALVLRLSFTTWTRLALNSWSFSHVHCEWSIHMYQHTCIWVIQSHSFATLRTYLLSHWNISWKIIELFLSLLGTHASVLVT